MDVEQYFNNNNDNMLKRLSDVDNLTDETENPVNIGTAIEPVRFLRAASPFL